MAGRLYSIHLLWWEVLEYSFSQPLDSGLLWDLPGPADCRPCSADASGLIFPRLAIPHFGVVGQLGPYCIGLAGIPADLSSPIRSGLDSIGLSFAVYYSSASGGDCAHHHSCCHVFLLLVTSSDFSVCSPTAFLSTRSPPDEGSFIAIHASYVFVPDSFISRCDTSSMKISFSLPLYGFLRSLL